MKGIRWRSNGQALTVLNNKRWDWAVRLVGPDLRWSGLGFEVVGFWEL